MGTEAIGIVCRCKHFNRVFSMEAPETVRRHAGRGQEVRPPRDLRGVRRLTRQGQPGARRVNGGRLRR